VPPVFGLPVCPDATAPLLVEPSPLPPATVVDEVPEPLVPPAIVVLVALPAIVVEVPPAVDGTPELLGVEAPPGAVVVLGAVVAVVGVTGVVGAELSGVEAVVDVGAAVPPPPPLVPLSCTTTPMTPASKSRATAARRARMAARDDRGRNLSTGAAGRRDVDCHHRLGRRMVGLVHPLGRRTSASVRTGAHTTRDRTLVRHPLL
jgi:hypothetical protein